MENNSNFRLNGLNPLAYMGVNPRTPVPFFSRASDPTTTDYANFILGTIWLNTSNENIWMLVKKVNFIATWVKFSSGSSGTVVSLTSNSGGAIMPTAGNINVVGDSSTIIGMGDPSTSTITLSTSGAVATSYDGNSGTATPLAHVLNIVGDGTTATVAAAGNTLTITAIGGGGSGTSSSLLGGGSSGALAVQSSKSWIAPNTGDLTLTQSSAQYSVPVAGTINNLYVNIGTNSTVDIVTITLNKNGTNTSLIATIPAGTTGVFTDLTHSISVVAGDTIQFEVSQLTMSANLLGVISAEFTVAGGGGSGTVVDVIGGNNITITGTSTLDPVVNVSGTTNHCVQIGNSTGSLTSIANGTTGQVLTAQTGADPIWSNGAGSYAFGGGSVAGSYAFSAYIASGSISVSGPTGYYYGSTVQMTTILDNTSGAFSPGTGSGSGSANAASFTSPATGLYSFTMTCSINGPVTGGTSPQDFLMSLFSTGSGNSIIYQGSINSLVANAIASPQISGTANMYLTTGQIAYFFVNVPSGSSVALVTGLQTCYVSGYRIA